MISLSSLPGYLEAAPKKKEVREYPDNDVHFVIKNGEEIEQARGFNQSSDLHASLQVVLDVEALALIMEPILKTYAEGRYYQSSYLAKELANSAEKFLRIEGVK